MTSLCVRDSRESEFKSRINSCKLPYPKFPDGMLTFIQPNRKLTSASRTGIESTMVSLKSTTLSGG